MVMPDEAWSAPRQEKLAPETGIDLELELENPETREFISVAISRDIYGSPMLFRTPLRLLPTYSSPTQACRTYG